MSDAKSDAQAPPMIECDDDGDGLCLLRGHTDDVRSVAFGPNGDWLAIHPDGERVAIASFTDAVGWEVSTGTKAFSFDWDGIAELWFGRERVRR